MRREHTKHRAACNTKIPIHGGIPPNLVRSSAVVAIRFPIETPRLFLRPFELEDAEELHRYWGDPAAGRWGGPYPTPRTVAETRHYLEGILRGQLEHGLSLWAVVERESGELVGDCGLFLADDVGPDIELAYGIRPDRRRRGYATEAAAACLRVAFEELGLPRVVADLEDPGNVASMHVLEKVGFVRIGEKRGKPLYAAEP
jgi:RimJ/RimL family protein N-acetyltransferase